MTNNYPNEIYKDPEDGISYGDAHVEHRLYGDEIAKIVEHAYDLGQENANISEWGKRMAERDTTDWHDLTAAIKAGEPIDWEKIDGRSAQLRKSTRGTQACIDIQELKAIAWPPSKPVHFKHAPACWLDEYLLASRGENGWSLYIDGPVPLKRKTADQLKPGTCFIGKCFDEVRDCILTEGRPSYYETEDGEEELHTPLNVTGINIYKNRSHKDASAGPVNWNPYSVEVLEVGGVGTFKAGDDV